ncbi:MAG: YhdH/YhfP family quinone oxidoreductase [Hydrogenophaga sp.]|uniref:YhdH/YhfP family quinone oxidoreductase n=1 Tax=Hydrogenophaga sp. TaxID=1904254 RepID=UPI001D386741|nr:YhdH/YhfP family quinone oxidoreductase [Hydrogenophaga sp.]MBX3609208.1 YhdH/YhfP family quinone oxidoreductase [Hydrogenophaga sp.]
MPAATTEFTALRTHQEGGRVWSRLERVRLDDLSEGEIVLRARHAGVNYKDCLAMLGRAKIVTAFPRVTGIEVVGDVLTSSDARFAPGDSVLVHGFQTGIAFDGGFSEIVRVPAGHVQPVPDGLGVFHTALLGVPGFTVAMALERFEQLGLKPDDGPVAVSGATGAVGLMAIAILSRAGWSVVALTRRMAQSQVLRELGATEVLDIGQCASSTRPLEKTRFAAAIDNVGGAVLSWLLRSMRDGGCVASVGNASGNAFDGSVLPFIVRRVQLFGVVANAPWPQRLRLWQRLASDLKPDFTTLMPHVHQIGLHDLLIHAEQQLRGEAGGRTMVRFGAEP